MPLGQHGEDHDAGGEHGLDDRQRGEGQGGDVEDPGAGRDGHADREPLARRTAACRAERMADVDRAGPRSRPCACRGSPAAWRWRRRARAGCPDSTSRIRRSPVELPSAPGRRVAHFIGTQGPRLESDEPGRLAASLNCDQSAVAAPPDRRRRRPLPLRVRPRRPSPGSSPCGRRHASLAVSAAPARTSARLARHVRVRLVHRLGGARRGAPSAPAGLPGGWAHLPSPGTVPGRALEAGRDRRLRGPDRPLAWIDDAHDDACHAWAAERPGRPC